MSSSASIRFLLRPVAPFRLDLTAWCLRRRPHNVIDRWDGETYRRVLVVNRAPIEVAVRQVGPPAKPAIEVAASAESAGTGAKRAIAASLTLMLGMDRELSGFYRIARCDSRLGPMVRGLLGMKPPRFPSLFEALANAIACQQLSLTAGLHVLNRFALRFGREGESGRIHAFPEPRDLIGADPRDLRALGFSYHKARALLDLAALWDRDNSATPADFEKLDDAAATARLSELRGVGRWTAEYVLLRGLGRLNVFPGNDIGAANKLKSWLGIRGDLDYEKIRRRLKRWHPYQGLIYFHLLVSSLVEQNLF